MKSIKSRRPLTEEEQEDTNRLRSIMEDAKNSRGITQQSVGLSCGWSGQQAVQAYLSGNTPLNLDAAFRFAKALDVPLDAISPRLAAKAVELFGATQAGQARPQTFEELLTYYAPEIAALKMTETGRQAITGLARAYEADPAAADRMARSLLALVSTE